MRRPEPIPRPERKTADPPRRIRTAAPIRALRSGVGDSDADGAPDAGPARTAASARGGTDDAVGLRAVWGASRARRRALRAESRRFTARTRRRRVVWIGALGALLLLVAGSVGAAYSPLFAVEDVHVVGTEQLDTADLTAALEGQVGTPLPLVDAGDVKAALLAFPLIESYAIEARPPHQLVVRIVERTAVGVVSSDAGYTVVDAAGVVLSTTSEPPEGQPIIDASGGLGSDAFAAAGQVLGAVPAELRERITTVTAESPEDVRFTLGATGTEVRWGSADESAMKALVLDRSMAALPPDSVGLYDVSSPEAVVVR